MPNLETMNNFIYLPGKNELVNLDNVRNIDFVQTSQITGRFYFGDREHICVSGHDLEVAAKALRFDLADVMKRTRQLTPKA